MSVSGFSSAVGWEDDDGTVQSISLSVTTLIYLCTLLHIHMHIHTNDTTTTASAHPIEHPPASSSATYRPPDPRH
jgi:hypothetical protein